MYQSTASQLEFLLPFGGHLDASNRWVRLSLVVPWAVAEQQYSATFENPGRGRQALSARIALGTLIIKERLCVTDRETVAQIRENPYLQYFLGFREYQQSVPFDASMLVHFRKRLGMSVLQAVNEALIASELHKVDESAASAADDGHDGPGGGGITAPEEMIAAPPAAPIKGAAKAPGGSLIIDATCAPADITYPTDLKLVNHAREITERVIDVLYRPLCGLMPKPRTYRRKARRRFLSAAKQRRLSAAKCRTAIGQQLRYIRRNTRIIERLLQHAPISLRLLNRTLYGKLLVSAEVYRQQRIMYQERIHRIDDRIVNIAQPHIRPIIRGKAGAPVEFGAKISASCADGFASLDRLSWSAYNEGGDVSMQAERYQQRYGCYPATIYADGIYRTRANRAWCAQRGIRLAGPPLGRPSTDSLALAERARAIRADERARVPIEGVFGRCKRRYSLQRVMAKLAKTSESVIALVFLVMNLQRILCAYLIGALLRLVAILVRAMTARQLVGALLPWRTRQMAVRVA